MVEFKRWPGHLHQYHLHCGSHEPRLQFLAIVDPMRVKHCMFYGRILWWNEMKIWETKWVSLRRCFLFSFLFCINNSIDLFCPFTHNWRIVVTCNICGLLLPGGGFFCWMVGVCLSQFHIQNLTYRCRKRSLWFSLVRQTKHTWYRKHMYTSADKSLIELLPLSSCTHCTLNIAGLHTFRFCRLKEFCQITR